MPTEKQIRILRLISDFTNKNGYSPTVRELGRLANLSSSSTIHGYLRRLESQGYIMRKEASPRALVITDKGEKLLSSSLICR